MTLTRRAKDPEIMDLGPSHYSLTEYQECLFQLDQIGRYLGGDLATFTAFKGLHPTSILDVGCGGGTFTRRLGKRFPQAKVLGVDIAADAIREAMRSSNVDFQHINALDFPSESFDVVTSTLVCHHMDDEELVRFLQDCYRIAKVEVIINDLHRHPLALYLFRGVSHLFFRNRLIRHDGILSIKKSFIKKEWEHYLRQAFIPLERCAIEWHFPFRWIVKIKKP